MGFQILQWILSFYIWSIPPISLVKWIVLIMTSKWISNPSEKISKCWTVKLEKAIIYSKEKYTKEKFGLLKKEGKRKKKTNDIRKVEEELGKNNMKRIEKRSIIIVILIFISSVCYNSLPLYIINEKTRNVFSNRPKGKN